MKERQKAESSRQKAAESSLGSLPPASCLLPSVFHPSSFIFALFYTAFADLLEPEEITQAGAQGFLRKPEDTARLGEVVRKLVEEIS